MIEFIASVFWCGCVLLVLLAPLTMKPPYVPNGNDDKDEAVTP